jgi:hypothetical protein
VKTLALAFAVVVILITVAVIWLSQRCANDRAVPTGTFVVLALTLIVLIGYAYDTNSIAHVTRERWAREGVLSTTYEMSLVDKKGEEGRTLFRLQNPSTLVVRAKVACNFRLYGAPVTAGPAYDGSDVWLLFPQQISQGWFSVDALAQQQGKSVAVMISESTPINRRNQLTMRLELEFWDEFGVRRKLPPRPHYFDFDRWAWIPQLTEAKPNSD